MHRPPVRPCTHLHAPACLHGIVAQATQGDVRSHDLHDHPTLPTLGASHPKAGHDTLGYSLHLSTHNAELLKKNVRTAYSISTNSEYNRDRNVLQNIEEWGLYA